MNAPKITRFDLPRSKSDELPTKQAFEGDDLYRARYFSAVVERYASKRADGLITWAREARLPGLTFADTVESMARFLHDGDNDALARLLTNVTKTKDQIRIEIAFNETLAVAARRFTPGDAQFFAFLAEGLATLFPGSARERIMSALANGNTKDGYRPSKVIESMFLTQPS